jgi:hypothetical protein
MLVWGKLLLGQVAFGILLLYRYLEVEWLHEQLLVESVDVSSNFPC